MTMIRREIVNFIVVSIRKFDYKDDPGLHGS